MTLPNSPDFSKCDPKKKCATGEVYSPGNECTSPGVWNSETCKCDVPITCTRPGEEPFLRYTQTITIADGRTFTGVESYNAPLIQVRDGFCRNPGSSTSYLCSDPRIGPDAYFQVRELNYRRTDGIVNEYCYEWPYPTSLEIVSIVVTNVEASCCECCDPDDPNPSAADTPNYQDYPYDLSP